MEFKNHIPIYLQLIDLIKKDIITKVLLPGDKLPSVRELSVKYAVNPNTVQKAYLEMERIGLAYSKRGIGTFIVDDKSIESKLFADLSTVYVNDFIELMREIGNSDDEIAKWLDKALKEDK